MNTAELHIHYYDYGYSDWSCVDCGSSTDYCDHNHFDVSSEEGCCKADRWPMGLPGEHPAFVRWAATSERAVQLQKLEG